MACIALRINREVKNMTKMTKIATAVLVALSIFLAGCTREANQGAEPATPAGGNDATTTGAI